MLCQAVASISLSNDHNVYLNGKLEYQILRRIIIIIIRIRTHIRTLIIKIQKKYCMKSVFTYDNHFDEQKQNQ